jgi:tRNA A-37 threonylcarbamoyl transferase component Bud32
MKNITSDDFAQLIKASKVLEKDGHGAKVILCDDGLIVKIFRRKRLLSGALLYPYVRRFANNSRRLKKRDVVTVDIVKLARCAPLKCDLIWYQPLPGETLRDYCRLNQVGSIIENVANFVALLHQKGVLFRSIHWGNIIVDDKLNLGLIDIADMRFYRHPLTIKQRQRNFRHMLRYAEDQQNFTAGAGVFWSCYQQASQLSASQCQQIKDSIVNSAV